VAVFESELALVEARVNPTAARGFSVAVFESAEVEDDVEIDVAVGAAADEDADPWAEEAIVPAEGRIAREDGIERERAMAADAPVVEDASPPDEAAEPGAALARGANRSAADQAGAELVLLLLPCPSVFCCCAAPVVVLDDAFASPARAGLLV